MKTVINCMNANTENRFNNKSVTMGAHKRETFRY
jgi:hypothetical protein